MRREPQTSPSLFGLFAADGAADGARALELEAVLPPEIFSGPPEAFARGVAQPSSRGFQRSRPTAKPRRLGLLRKGAIVDKYRIEQVLGTGGFGAVYRATHLLLQSPVALKLLHTEILAREPGISVQLVAEARFAARINHPNVVRVFDVTSTPELTFVVMELIEGPTLARAIACRGPLSVPRVARLGIDVASGLRAAHAEGLIHRDIKPANILLSASGQARIVDFGLAHVASDEAGSPMRGTVGTRGYMAPEQTRPNGPVDFRADIFALGATLYEATFAMQAFARGGERRPLDAAPRPLAKLLGAMLADRPADRPSSYDEIISSLASLTEP